MKKLKIRDLTVRIFLVLFDILAVNLSYYMALITRFYVAGVFNEYARHFMDAFYRFTPFYTVACLIVFFFSKLYSSMWKYAGINDMNRILIANLITFVVQVVGSCVFVMRMPISYYCIGFLFQICLIAAIRLFYRVLTIEKKKLLSDRKKAINAIIIGSGESARMALKQLERNSIATPVCVISTRDNEYYGMLNGIPTQNGIENLKDAIAKYNADLIVVADNIVNEDTKNYVNDICSENEIEVRYFLGYCQNMSREVSLKEIAVLIDGNLYINENGNTELYDSGEQALMNYSDNYSVISISAKDNAPLLQVKKRVVLHNDLNEKWVKEQEKATGESISFF